MGIAPRTTRRASALAAAALAGLLLFVRPGGRSRPIGTEGSRGPEAASGPDDPCEALARFASAINALDLEAALVCVRTGDAAARDGLRGRISEAIRRVAAERVRLRRALEAQLRALSATARPPSDPARRAIAPARARLRARLAELERRVGLRIEATERRARRDGAVDVRARAAFEAMGSPCAPSEDLLFTLVREGRGWRIRSARPAASEDALECVWAGAFRGLQEALRARDVRRLDAILLAGPAARRADVLAERDALVAYLHGPAAGPPTLRLRPTGPARARLRIEIPCGEAPPARWVADLEAAGTSGAGGIRIVSIRRLLP